MNRAVFLDRDGTLIAEKNYLHRPEEVEIFPEAFPALKKLSAAGYKLVIVTNQSAIGRGYFTLADAENVNAHVAAEFARHGIHFEKTYIAPEAPEQPSRGRKPSPQFLFDARDEFKINLAESFMVGDKLIDLECGWNAGVKTSILVRTGYGKKSEAEAKSELARAVVMDGLAGVADWILNSGF